MARAPEKSEGAFRTIREVADWLGVPTHVLRFWESKFAQIEPVKGAGGRRYYRPEDMRLLGGIKVLLHDEGLPIRGVVQKIDAEGIDAVMAHSPSLDRADPPPRPRRVIRSDDDRTDAARIVSFDRAREEAAGDAIRRDAPAEPELPEDLPSPSDPSPSQPDVPDDDETAIPPQPADRPVPEPSEMPDQPDPPKTRSDDLPDPAGPNPTEPVEPETDAIQPEEFPEVVDEPELSTDDDPIDLGELGDGEADAPSFADDDAEPMPNSEDEPVEPAAAFTIPEPIEPETAEPVTDVAAPEPEFKELFPAEPAVEDAVVEAAPSFGTSRPAAMQTIYLTPVNRRALRRVVRKLRGLIEEVEAELDAGVED